MCIIECGKTTGQILNGPSSFIAYKVVRSYRDKIGHRNKIFSICFPYKWQIGENKSGYSKLEINRNKNRGIHVFLTKQWVYDWKIGDDEYVLPVRVYKKDLIVGGAGSEAVFTKVYVSKQSYQKVLNLKRNKKC
jgi:hypothetical protein